MAFTCGTDGRAGQSHVSVYTLQGQMTFSHRKSCMALRRNSRVRTVGEEQDTKKPDPASPTACQRLSSVPGNKVLTHVATCWLSHMH